MRESHFVVFPEVMGFVDDRCCVSPGSRGGECITWCIGASPASGELMLPCVQQR